jgi:hypothetical protein
MKRVSSSHLFVLLFLIINLRGMLGYIFRFGDPTSSPTYSPVPPEYFLFWDIVIGLMVVLVACKTRKISIRYALIYLLTLLISFVCLFKAESFYVRGASRSIILYGFFFLCLYSNGSWIKISHINKAIEFMAAFGLVFLLYQIYQYKYFGVLPAHSHKFLSIRYGSFYNDSLILGILLPMFYGYFYYKYNNTAFSLPVAVIVCLAAVLTGSITAICIVFLYVTWTFRRQYVLLLPFLCSVLFISFYFTDTIKKLWSFKSGSIAAHLEGLSHFKELEMMTLTGLYPLDRFIEIGYLSFLYNFGVPVLLAALALSFVTLRACRVILSKNTSDGQMQAFAGATEGLTISVLLANLNLPLIVYPPVYLFAVIFSAIAIKQAEDTNFRRISAFEFKPPMPFSKADISGESSSFK